jgi:hypothetical protein
MALIYQPTKLDKRIIAAVKDDVKKCVYTSKNSAYNIILSKHYGIDLNQKKDKKDDLPQHR